MKKILFIIILAVISFTAQAQFSARYSKLHIGNPGVDFKLVSNKSLAQEDGGGTFTLVKRDDFTTAEIMALYNYFEEHKEEIEKKYNLLIVRNNLNWVKIQYGNAARPEIVIYDRDIHQQREEARLNRIQEGNIRNEAAMAQTKTKIENLFSK